MDKNLEAYVRVYDNWIGSELCDAIIEDLQTLSWETHAFYNPYTNEYLNRSGDNELDVTVDSKFSPLINDRVWHAYDKYTKELGFSWFCSWQGFSGVRFNRYTESKQMALHCDHIHTLFDGPRRGIPTMTCLIILNDGFEGGEFIMFGDTEIKLAKGSVVVFPANFLYPHLVQPVTKGTRYSCVAWAW